MELARSFLSQFHSKSCKQQAAFTIGYGQFLGRFEILPGTQKTGWLAFFLAFQFELSLNFGYPTRHSDLHNY